MKIKDFVNGYFEKNLKPVLAPGKKGAWDDMVAGTPRIFKRKKNDYLLFYTGQNRRNVNWGIGLAHSNDLFHWKKFPKAILTGDKTGWDSRIDGVNIIFCNNQYYLFYEGTSSKTISQNLLIKLMPLNLRHLLGSYWRKLSNSFNSLGAEHVCDRAIGYAISKDLFQWEKYQNNPVLKKGNKGWDKEGISSPCVLKVGKSFVMFYSGSDGKKVSSGMAESTNLSKWKKISGNPVIKPGTLGSWDERVVTVSSVFKVEDGYLCLYEGLDKKNVFRIGCAYSFDLKTWEKSPHNPILDVGRRGSVDESLACGPQIYEENGQYYIFYVGHDKNMFGYSCLAKLIK